MSAAQADGSGGERGGPHAVGGSLEGEQDAAPPASDGGSTTASDAAGDVTSDGGGAAPGSEPTRALDGSAPQVVDASFGWLTDGAVPGTHDASTSVRDGGLVKFDPDASGPVLNPEAQAACIGLMNNLCNRSADCQVSLLGAAPEQRTRLFESCRNSFWRARNCNRATRTASGFAQCSESSKSRECLLLLAMDFAASCSDQITFEP